MTRSLQPLGTAKFMLAMLTPWRPAFRTRAANSGATFFVSARDVVGRHIAKYGGHEPGLTAWVDRYLGTQPRGIVVDVGANIGWHTVHAARCPTVETVVAFEPDAFNCWLLDRNIEANALDNVIVLKSAVGAEAGTARLHLYKASNNGRHSSARRERDAFAHRNSRRYRYLAEPAGSRGSPGIVDEDRC